MTGHLVDHVVGEVLVEVGQAVGVLGQRLVLAPQPVTRRDLGRTLSSFYCHSSIVTMTDLPELYKVHHIDGRDVILASCQVIPPVTLLPEPRNDIVVSEWHENLLQSNLKPSMSSLLSQKGV